MKNCCLTPFCLTVFHLRDLRQLSSPRERVRLGGKTTKIGFKNTKNTVFSPCEQKHTKNTVQYKRPAERARGGALVRHVTRRMRANPWVTRGRTRTRIAPRAPRVRPTARRLQRPCRGRSHWSRHLQQHWSRQQFKRHLRASASTCWGVCWRAGEQKHKKHSVFQAGVKTQNTDLPP